MERFDSFPLSFTAEHTIHHGVVRTIKPDMKVTVKIAALGIFMVDGASHEETISHTFATFSKQLAADEMTETRQYRGGCRLRSLNAMLDLSLNVQMNGDVIGTATLVDENGKFVIIKDVQIVLNFMIAKQDSK